MAAFLPLLPRTQEIARQFIVVVHSTLTSLPPSLLPGLSTQVCTLATNFAERRKSALSPLQLLCLHVANGISVLYTSGLFSADEAMGYVRLLADLATQAPLVCLYLSVSLAVFHMLVYICFSLSLGQWILPESSYRSLWACCSWSSWYRLPG